MHKSILMAVMIGACSTMGGAMDSDVIFLKANIEKFGDISEMAGGGEEIIHGASIEALLSPVEELIGRIQSSKVAVRLVMSALPSNERFRKIYVLGRKSNGGSIDVVRWNFVSDGFCVSKEIADKMQIRGQLLKLVDDKAIEWNPNCNWDFSDNLRNP